MTTDDSEVETDRSGAATMTLLGETKAATQGCNQAEGIAERVNRDDKRAA